MSFPYSSERCMDPADEDPKYRALALPVSMMARDELAFAPPPMVAAGRAKAQLGSEAGRAAPAVVVAPAAATAAADAECPPCPSWVQPYTTFVANMMPLLAKEAVVMTLRRFNGIDVLVVDEEPFVVTGALNCAFATEFEVSFYHGRPSDPPGATVVEFRRTCAGGDAFAVASLVRVCRAELCGGAPAPAVLRSFVARPLESHDTADADAEADEQPGAAPSASAPASEREPSSSASAAAAAGVATPEALPRLLDLALASDAKSDVLAELALELLVATPAALEAALSAFGHARSVKLSETLTLFACDPAHAASGVSLASAHALTALASRSRDATSPSSLVSRLAAVARAGLRDIRDAPDACRAARSIAAAPGRRV